MKPTQYVELEVFSSTEEPSDSTESNADAGAGTSEDTDTDPTAVRRSGRVRQRPNSYYVERVFLA